MKVSIYDGDWSNAINWWAELEEPTVDCLVSKMKWWFDLHNPIIEDVATSEILRGGRKVPLENVKKYSGLKFIGSENISTGRPLIAFQAHYTRQFYKAWLEVSYLDEEKQMSWPMYADKSGKLHLNKAGSWIKNRYFTGPKNREEQI